MECLFIALLERVLCYSVFIVVFIVLIIILIIIIIIITIIIIIITNIFFSALQVILFSKDCISSLVTLGTYLPLNGLNNMMCF